jgi:hypothetical protein
VHSNIFMSACLAARGWHTRREIDDAKLLELGDDAKDGSSNADHNKEEAAHG